MSSLRLQILGSSSATPTRNRNPSAQVLTIGSRKILIDCGEGTQHQMIKFGVRFQKIDVILISHMHGDHYFGLIGLLSTMSIMGRKNELVLIAPPELKQIIDLQLKSAGHDLDFPLNFIPNNPKKEDVIYETRSFKITVFPLVHRIPCSGFIIQELYDKYPLNYKKCRDLKIPKEYYDRIKSGVDYTPINGETIPFEELVYPKKKQLKYAYVSDTLFHEDLQKYVREPDLLYHEATFLHDLKKRAKETFHTTAKQAGKMARLCGSGQLIIGHYSARYNSTEKLAEEARAEFPNVVASYEGLEIDVLPKKD